MKRKIKQINGIIDIHSHILPGVDDGSRNLEETVELLKKAYQQGISTIIATPHYHAQNNNTETSNLKELKDLVQKKAEEIDSELRIYAGNELYYSESLLEDLRQGKALTLADSHYILVEFTPNVSYEKLYQGIRSLVMGGYLIIIAHMERYDCLYKQADRLEELRRIGCYMQMNFESIQGGIFKTKVRNCRKLILDGWIDFLASDSHRMLYRPYEIGKALKWLIQHCEEKYLEDLFINNPKYILENQIF